MNRTQILKLDGETIKRYNKRLKEYGDNPRTLGWDNHKSQIIRFQTATKYTEFDNRTILDIGCGLGDFYEYLDEHNEIQSYKGIDINDKLLSMCIKKYPECGFENRNILLNNFNDKRFDIVTLFGLLNFKIENNIEYTKQMINEAWKITNKNLIVDFLSSNLTKDYPKEDFVYYHNPKDVLDISFELTDDLILLHNYRPIPQKEFMIILKK